MKDKWEKVTEGCGYYLFVTYRLKVFNGWLVKNESWEQNSNRDLFSQTMVFVPDQNHEWKID